jgi:hypothetical protein
MSVYQEHRRYSVTLGCDAVRLSLVDDRGGEFYRVVPAVRGKKWREERDRVLDEIEDAIAAGCDPGEVP